MTNITSPSTLTWKEVLYTQHTWWASMRHECVPMAQKLGFKYFSWNGRIYDAETGEDTGIFETDIL